MALTASAYGPLLRSLFEGEVDLGTDPIKVMLTTNAYAPDQDTHRYVSDVTNEVSGAAYTAGGKELTGATLTYNAPTNTLTIDANDVTWPASTITARRAVFYVDAGSKPLLCWWDFGQDEISSSGNFTLTLSGSGLITASTP